MAETAPDSTQTNQPIQTSHPAQTNHTAIIVPEMLSTTPFKQWAKLRLLPVIVFAIMLLAGLTIVNNYHDLWRKEQNMLMAELASSQGATLQKYLSHAFSATYVLKSLIETDPNNIDNFETYAKNIIRSQGGMTNLQLAPGGIVKHIYPLEGHEKAIGHNILRDDKRREEAMLAIAEKKLTLAGPFELIQGGVAVIGRNPIFLVNSKGEKQFWGFASALIYVDDLLAATDLDKLGAKGYHYQLSKISGNAESSIESTIESTIENTIENTIAESNMDMASDETIVKQIIEVPNGQWVLSMGLTVKPWHHLSIAIQIILVICFSLLIGYVTYILLRQPLYLQRQVDRKTQALNQLAFYDPLTKLCNRRLFNDLLIRMMASIERDNTRVALLYLDLDDFKRINDSFGHENGDQLLKVVAERLSKTVRKSDIVARIGGDEFCVLLPNIQTRNNAAQVADKILDVIGKPIKLGSHSVRVTPSIGITLAPDDSADATQLLKNADMAMYSAKEHSRNNYQFYVDELNTNTLERLILEREISQAVENHEFVLNFQPQISLPSGTTTGVEALVRWRHPSRGMLGPGDFIELAEDSRLIVPLGAWVLEQACLQLKKLNRPELRVSVNLSPRQFADPNLLDTIEKALSSSGLQGHQLELEITETALMKNMEKAVDTLKQIKSLGVLIAIDDFGTGYSSLSQLKNLPADTLKIDREFINDITERTDNAVITEVIISVGHKLGLTVIAEGVETQAQLDFITQIQCDMAQGYLFSKPLTMEELTTFLNNDQLEKKASTINDS